jgi:tetratricopeptide (TPR) repeat protein
MGLVIDLLKILSAELIIILPAMIGLLALMLYRKNPTTVVNPITDLHQSTSSELSDLYHQTTAVKNGLTQIVDPSPQQPLAWLRRYQTPILSPGLPRLPQKSPPRWLHPDNHRFPALPAAHNGVNHPRDARDELAKSLFHSPVKQSLSDLSDLGDLPSVLLEAIDLPIVEGLAPTYEETQQTSADSVTALEADDAPQPDHKSVVSAEYYIRRGNFLFLRHQYHEAIAWYQRAIHINPDHYMAWFSKGFALTQLQHYDEALKAYDQVIQLKESYHLAWYNRGKVLEELQQYGDALASYQKALELRSELSR